MQLSGGDLFNEALLKYFESLYRYAYGFLKDEDLAKDVVLDVFDELKEDETDFSMDGVEKWLWTATRNNCIDRLRRNKAQKKKYDQYWREHGRSETDPSLESILAKAKLFGLIREKLKDLPSEQRRAVEEYYLKGKKTKELAEELGITESTVNQNKYKGIKALRDIFRYLRDRNLLP
jgi:RNA polymerase sigma factor (sigma-70 family)